MRELKVGSAGEDVRKLKVAGNKRLESRDLSSLKMNVKDHTIRTAEMRSFVKLTWALGAQRDTLDLMELDDVIPIGVQKIIRWPNTYRTDRNNRLGAVRVANMRYQRRRRKAAREKERRERATHSRARAVNAFLARVGTRESPPGSNGGGIITVMESYWGFGRVAWCGIAFGYFAEKYGGVDLRSDVASVQAVTNHAKAHHNPYGVFRRDPGGALPGSGVIIGGPDVHIGMLVESLGNGAAKTVEGNCLAADEPVLTPCGWFPISSLSVGDPICDPEGGQARVLGVYANGVQDVFAVRTGDGATVRATADHLWIVGKGRGISPRWATLTTTEMADLIRKGTRVRLPSIAPQEFIADDLPLDPYMLGVLIGDGCLRGCSPQITTNDQEMVDEIAQVLPVGVRAVATEDQRNGTRGVRFSRPQGRGGNDRSKSVITEILIDLDLMGRTAPEKFVPNTYKWAGIKQRLALLQGLMDADGGIDLQGRAEFCSTSRLLAEDVQFLIRSLGGRASLFEKGAITYTSPAQADPKTARDAYVLRNIRLPGMSLFRLTRKAQRQRERLPGAKQWSVRSVEPAGRREVVCIETSASSRLYLTRGLIPTHNTSFGPGGSQSNGGCITTKIRSGEIYGIATMLYPHR